MSEKKDLLSKKKFNFFKTKKLEEDLNKELKKVKSNSLDQKKQKLNLNKKLNELNQTDLKNKQIENNKYYFFKREKSKINLNGSSKKSKDEEKNEIVLKKNIEKHNPEEKHFGRHKHSTKPLLKITNLSKNYGYRKILENLSFEVYDGEILCILGLSGSGKTTLLKMICGYLKPTSGRVMYDGKFEGRFRFLREQGIVRSLIGFSSQDPSFYPNLTVEENLRYFATLLGLKKIETTERIDEILEILDLNLVKPVLSSGLSEGMKKRLDIACAIIHKPKILILDEPTANLDYKLREELLQYVKKINRQGMTILFVSHYIEEVEMIAQRIVIIAKNQGIIIDEKKNLKMRFARLIR